MLKSVSAFVTVLNLCISLSFYTPLIAGQMRSRHLKGRGFLEIP